MKPQDYYKAYYKNNGYKGESQSVYSRFAFIRKWLNDTLKPDACILDIGCGDASLARDLKNFQYFGLDLNTEHAISHSVKSHDLEEIPYPYESQFFDAIVISEVLEHMFDPHEILVEAKRILKDDGILIVSTPNSNWIDYDYFPEMFTKAYRKAHPHTFEHIRHYDHHSWAEIFDETGYKVERFTGADAQYSAFFSMPRALMLKLCFNEEVQLDSQNRYIQTENLTHVDMMLGEAFAIHMHTIMFMCRKK